MNNKRCPSCGFINFASAAACRKCETSLHLAGTPQPGGQQTLGSPYGSGYGYQYRPQRKSGIPVWAKACAAVGVLIVVAFVASVAGLVLFVKSHSKLEWQEFQPGEQGLSVMMPGPPNAHDPIVTPAANGEIKNYIYTSTVIGQGSATFYIVTFPDSFNRDKIQSDKIDKVLDAEMDNMLKEVDATLVSKSRFDEGEVKGLSFEFKPQSKMMREDERGYGKLYLTANRLYALTLVARKNSELHRSKEKFLKPTIPYL